MNIKKLTLLSIFLLVILLPQLPVLKAQIESFENEEAEVLEGQTDEEADEAEAMLPVKVPLIGPEIANMVKAQVQAIDEVATEMNKRELLKLDSGKGKEKAFHWDEVESYYMYSMQLLISPQLTLRIPAILRIRIIPTIEIVWARRLPMGKVVYRPRI